MEFNLNITRRLHEEHAATLVLWSRLEQLITGRGAQWPPAEGDAIAKGLRECAATLAQEVADHFAFEEAQLFPRLEEGGEGDIAQLLAEEHGVIREAARQFGDLQARGARGALDEAGWRSLRTLALELVERLVSHVQKEEMSLLPALEDLIDEDQDRALITDYSMG
ncbi:MAG TPA: hemerythrin domain-containing protein [Burkholderiales bacterium]|nr:hemerythrin domain-containing protein [Burkholderiales bacterium]